MSEVNSTPAPAGSRLIPLTRWPDVHPWPPLGGLRHLVFHADENGFKAAFVRVGRRILVDERAFFEAAKYSATARRKRGRK